MQKLTQFTIGMLSLLILSTSSFAQDQKGQDSVSQINVKLLGILNQKTPSKYKIRSIKVVGNQFFDENLLLSLSTLNEGDEVALPGGDNFAKAIRKLMDQNYFSDVQIYVTKLEGKNIWLEINVTERPRLSKYEFTGINKSDKEDLMGKSGLVPNRIVTENMKRSAKEAIEKYYAEKAYKNVQVNINEKRDTSFGDAVVLIFEVNRGQKVKVNNIDFAGNTLDPLKLKKQMKDTKEMSRLTLHKPDDISAFGSGKTYTFNEYLAETGYLTYSKTKKILDPYLRIKIFSSAKFNQKKYEEDLDKLLEFYNAQGFRDAAINKDGIVLSQPPRRTTPSIGLARIISSVAIAAILRHNIAVGRTRVSPRETAGIFSGTPPASQIPFFTYSITSFK